MVAKNRTPRPEVFEENEEEGGIRFLTEEEGVAYFDQRARKLLGISGDEFLRRWDAGEYQPVPDYGEGRKVARLSMLIAFARPTDA